MTTHKHRRALQAGEAFSLLVFMTHAFMRSDEAELICVLFAGDISFHDVSSGVSQRTTPMVRFSMRVYDTELQFLSYNFSHNSCLFFAYLADFPQS